MCIMRIVFIFILSSTVINLQSTSLLSALLAAVANKDNKAEENQATAIALYSLLPADDRDFAKKAITKAFFKTDPAGAEAALAEAAKGSSTVSAADLAKATSASEAFATRIKEAQKESDQINLFVEVVTDPKAAGGKFVTNLSDAGKQEVAQRVGKALETAARTRKASA